ncbi:unnamed protein product [Meloidogyne enterolobii]|uniref:Uncharacterized protein n=1 Tax=Meloidogyne enterolobii TaxID=390850 RepID=A0ACB1AGP9_MELEN
MNIEKKRNIFLENFRRLIKESFFLSQKIRIRYYYMDCLLFYGLKEVIDNSQNPLTRTGKVYKTFPNRKELWYNDASETDENIFVKIFETKAKILIDSETPMAIVELIEEVKNERKVVKEMNDEEFKKKWNEATIDELKYNHDKDVAQKLKVIRSEQAKILKENLKELKVKYEKIEKELKEFKTKRNNLEVSIKLKEKINERDEMSKKIKEIEDKNYKESKVKLNTIENEQKKIWEEKLEKIKFENEQILKESMEIKRKEMLEKYNDFIVELIEMWFRVVFYHVYDKVYENDAKKKITIKIIKESEKGKASTSSNIKTIQDEEDVLYFNKITLIKKTFLPKIYGKENAVKLVKGKKDSVIFVHINGKITKEGKF